ncbi:uncharacterized protein [Rutidosis leptorrhynchoides]|uniref:uncharacterized protein n=1 Tax=Rutidosis leptorrhynchoides TaxID=125765 RepID=UPI003A996A4F
MEAVCKSFDPPIPLSKYGNRDKSKFFNFHDDYGHETNECRHLIEKIVAELKRGRLQHLKKGGKASSEKPKGEKEYPWKRKNDGRETEKIINMAISGRANQIRKLEFPEEWENTPILFPAMAQQPSDAPITIKGHVKGCGYIIKRLHIDTGCDVDIMYEHCFRLLPGAVRAKLIAPSTALSGFSGESAWLIGIIELELELVDDNNEFVRSTIVEFDVVRSYSKYNALLGRTTSQKLAAIPSTVHGLIKFPTPSGIATIRSETQDTSVATVEQAEKQPSEEEQLRKLHDHLRQKKRGIAPERNEWLKAEVDKLVKANILREVLYQTWVANPVLVKKPDGSWRIYVDFPNINKAYPKDNYPLLEIDWKVESLAGFRYKCFLDAYKGYHQIQVVADDEDKTAFHTSQGIYCYTKMPFGLKNAGATYQRVIYEAFKSQIGRNLEAYVDDLVIKSTTEQGLLDDILETFVSLRKINMKLNPSKCSFGEEEGNFLGHIITERGIRANLKKIEAIESMSSPRNKKEVQSLTGKLAALTRFLSKSAERSLPFFGTLKNCLRKTDFKWTEEVEVAFQEMKKLLKEFPTMTAPIAGETLILYLAASKEAISSEQMPVYFVSKALTGSELNYPVIEKLVLYKPENSGHMAKWAIELGEHEISFSPRSAVKGQVLADYLAETAGDIEISHESKEIPPPPEHLWEMHTDGACGPEGPGAGIVLKVPEGEEYTFALRFSFPVTNNEAEYEALLSGMRVAKYLEVKELSVYVDSQLVANQFNGIFEAHDESMQKYLKLVQELAVDFDIFQIIQVSRTLNKKAGALSKLAALTFNNFKKEIGVEEVKVKSIDTDGISSAVEEDEPSWMTSIVEFLNTGTLPIDSTESRKIKMKAPMYLLDKGILYKSLFRTSFAVS